MNQLTAGLIVVVGILGGFYVGAKYGQGHPPPSSTPAVATNATGFGGGAATGAGGAAAGRGGFGGAGNATAGTITAVSGDTITVHNARTNADVKINVSSARITKTADGAPSDLTANQTVTVVGQAGSDGVVNATTIAVGVGLGARGGAAASPSPGG
jgi:hypothetical protein